MVKKYKLGDKWSSDFDYCGMLKQGSKANMKLGLKKLNKLFDSYEDVNYHTESAPLLDAIQNLEKKNIQTAKKQIISFNALSKHSFKNSCSKKKLW